MSGGRSHSFVVLGDVLPFQVNTETAPPPYRPPTGGGASRPREPTCTRTCFVGCPDERSRRGQTTPSAPTARRTDLHGARSPPHPWSRSQPSPSATAIETGRGGPEPAAWATQPSRCQRRRSEPRGRWPEAMQTFSRLRTARTPRCDASGNRERRPTHGGNQRTTHQRRVCDGGALRYGRLPVLDEEVVDSFRQ